MAEFFHVSRTDISFLEEFKLFPHEGGIDATTLHTAEEFNNLKSYLYPNGISSHGQNYLQRPYQSCGPNNAFCPNELVIEITFELIRQLNFPQKKSRFECFFGCTTIDDAIQIKQTTFNNQGKIYKVSCESYSIYDMNLLRQAGSVIGLKVTANKYWGGQSTENPFWEVLMESPVKILEAVN